MRPRLRVTAFSLHARSARVDAPLEGGVRVVLEIPAEYEAKRRLLGDLSEAMEALGWATSDQSAQISAAERKAERAIERRERKGSKRRGGGAR